jgi:putative phage-type endonuclease
MNPISIDKKILDTAKARNFSTNLIKTLNIPPAEIDKRLKYYYSIPQPPQKSQAWLDQRINYITASSFSNALCSKWSSYRNELMKNKVSKGSYNNFFGNEATRWGEKYEDVCAAVYCYRNNVEVFDFGMIPHPKYPFLGASTDGITTKLINLEIKSPFSRVIKPGVVKDNYWQQMQLQMDVLDLNLSHFLECTFHEYPSERDFWIDFDYEGLANPEKGIVVEIVNREVMDNSGVPKTMYIYSPIPLCENANQLRVWHKQVISDIINSKDRVYIRSHFWILSMYSCVNVIRDREWFNQQIPKFIEFWNEVETYRKNGGLEKLSNDIEVNKPKSRKIKVESPPSKLKNNKISLEFDDDGIDNDLPPGYIMSSSDEEIDKPKKGKGGNRNNNDDFEDDFPIKKGSGCLIESSDEEDQPTNRSDERIKLDQAIEASANNLKIVQAKLKNEIPVLPEKAKPTISQLKFKRERKIPVDYDISSNSSNTTTTSSNTSYLTDGEDSEDSIFRPDPYRPKTSDRTYRSTRYNDEYDNNSNGSSTSNGSRLDEEDEDTAPTRPIVEQPKYFKRYKSKKDANKKRIEARKSSSRSSSRSLIL